MGQWIPGGTQAIHLGKRPSVRGLFPATSGAALLSLLAPILSHFCPHLVVLPSYSVDPIDEAWARVEAEWGDEEAHRRFVGVCVALDQLPEAGKRYREVRETDAARRETAAKQIDKLIALATQQLQDTRIKPATTEHKRTLTWVAFFIMLMLMGAGAWLLIRG